MSNHHSSARMHIFWFARDIPWLLALGDGVRGRPDSSVNQLSFVEPEIVQKTRGICVSGSLHALPAWLSFSSPSAGDVGVSLLDGGAFSLELPAEGGRIILLPRYQPFNLEWLFIEKDLVQLDCGLILLFYGAAIHYLYNVVLLFSEYWQEPLREALFGQSMQDTSILNQ